MHACKYKLSTLTRIYDPGIVSNNIILVTIRIKQKSQQNYLSTFSVIELLKTELNSFHIGSNSKPFSRFILLLVSVVVLGFSALMYNASLSFLQFQWSSLSKKYISFSN